MITHITHTENKEDLVIDDDILPATSSALIIHEDFSINMYLAKLPDNDTDVPGNTWLISGVAFLLTDKKYSKKLSKLIQARIDELKEKHEVC